MRIRIIGLCLVAAFAIGAIAAAGPGRPTPNMGGV